MKMYNIPYIDKLHIELSSRCNASCPACSRNFAGGATIPNLKLTDLSLEDVQQMFPDQITKNITHINYCGNVGDPAMAPDLIPILQFFASKAERPIYQQIRTNGGMRNPEFWTKLGEFFATQTRPAHGNEFFHRNGVVFSVDGLEDTNHIYRRGVKWEKLYANMKAYAATGADGIWEWLLFEHNQHQVEEAQALAKELGLLFIVKNPMGFGEYTDKPHGINVYDKKGAYEYSIYPVNFTGTKDNEPHGQVVDFASLPPHGLEPSEYNKELARSCSIKCKSLERQQSQEVYISSGGYLLPCCFLGGTLGQSDTSHSRYQFNKKINELGMDKFDLRKHNMLEILEGPYFSKFFLDGWKAPTLEEGKLLFCAEVCGERSAMDKLYETDFNPRR